MPNEFLQNLATDKYSTRGPVLRALALMILVASFAVTGQPLHAQPALMDGGTNIVVVPTPRPARSVEQGSQKWLQETDGLGNAGAAAIIDTGMTDNGAGTSAQSSNADTPDSTANACLIALQKIATVVQVVQPQPKDAVCVVENPVSLAAIKRPSGNISMPGDMLNRCGFALEFSRWLGDVANPLAQQHLGSEIASVRSGPGFVCRRRNNKPTGKLSEHAFGNAIDITGFKLVDGKTFSIADPAKMKPEEARFFAALRKTACGYFTTVLGPGSNVAHASHLHFDLGVHGKTGNYKICE